MSRRRALAALPATGLVVLVAASLAHAGSDILTSVKEPGGNYSDAIEVDVDPGETKVFPLRAKNQTMGDLEATLEEHEGSSHSPKIKVRWFRRGHDITAAVKGPGYDFPIGGGKRKQFKVRIEAKGNGKACALTTGSSGGSGSTAFIIVNGATCVI